MKTFLIISALLILAGIIMIPLEISFYTWVMGAGCLLAVLTIMASYVKKRK